MKEFDIKKIIKSLKNAYGEEFISSITMQLHKLIDADYTFVAKLDLNRRVSQTISLAAGDSFGKNFEYALQHTPCEDVSQNNTCVYSKGVCHHYPNDQLLIDMGIEGYIGSPLLNSSGQVFGLIVTLFKHKISHTENISALFELFAGRISAEVERLEKEQEIAANSQRYKAVLSTSKDGFWETDIDGKILEVNGAYCKMSGYSEEELMDMYIWQLDAEQPKPIVLKRIAKICLEGGAIFESTHRHKNGQIFPVEIMVSYSGIEGGSCFVFIRDISERKRHEDKIKHMAYFDELTNLPNRQLLTDRLKQSLLMANRTKKLVAILFLDLDGFKEINDQFGHSVGDEVLVSVSNRIMGTLRETDTFARIGGDEFIMVLPGLESVLEGEKIAKRTIEDFSKPFDIQGNRLHISTSIGVTYYPIDNNDTDILLRHADQAMYAAKKQGKNTYSIFDTVENTLEVQRYQKVADFKRAIEQDQLRLYYQPRIYLRSGCLASVEALIRWQHPDKGLLAPSAFLPHIKDSPLEIALDEWVLKKALEQQVEWLEQGLEINISVNISPRYISQQSFVDYLRRLLDSFPHGTARYLEIEIVENHELGDVKAVANIMNQCKSLGVTFSLDDFGTGYSSLNHFHSLPLSVLKIDQSFVYNIETNELDKNIVKGAIQLAHAVNMPVVAEGVETVQLGKILKELGCELAQGYGIAKPMPAEELFTWSKNFEHGTVWKSL
ncbi:putative bifunctional diguanylate cyclase/phosphodiesterase [Aeromonas fluvialis]|uniref:putative bifunctional diguanylate cyclase/phosphodiesterase n=1 Tax=Aeromonas fluvialis TaxID=591962 RepID=UPI000694A177|nr:EAL domain-containing protein [Aeromonas fluvialis]